MHGTTPNDLVKLEYIEFRATHTGEKYVLMLRDDHSGSFGFYPCSVTASDVAADALIDWSAAFGASNLLMSDGPTHFKNVSIPLLEKGLHAQHHFTLPYFPWFSSALKHVDGKRFLISRKLLSKPQSRQDE